MLVNAEDQKMMIQTHATWDDAKSSNIVEWLSLAAPLDDFSTIIDQRLKANPDEIVSIRAVQDHGKETDKEAVCKKYQALAQQNVDNSDYQYLSIRCMEDGPAKTEAFMKAYNKNYNHPWLSFAAGYTFLDEGEWEKAYNALLAAFRNEPALHERLGLDIERLYRLNKAKGITLVGRMDDSTPDLDYYRALESGTDSEIINGPEHAYFYIQQGKLDEAMVRVQNNPDYRNTILYLAAASDGARPEWIEEALKLKHEEQINNKSLFPAIAIMARANKDLSAFQPILDQVHPEANQWISDFIKYARSKRYREAEEIMKEKSTKIHRSQ